MSGIFKGVKGLDKNLPEEPKKETNMSESWKGVADQLLSVIEERAGDFMAHNAAAKDFVRERGERLAKLMIEYKLAPDSEKEAKKDRMELVRSTIETELAALALSAQAESRTTFETVVKTAFSAIVKVLPTVISAI